jgi:hypothetical protein
MEAYLLLAHGADNGDQEILSFVKPGLDVISEVTLRHLDIILGNAILCHKIEEAIVDIDLSEVLSRARYITG